MLLFNYASRKGDEDMGNSFYQDMRSKAMSLAVALESATAFAVPELLAIPDETLERFFAEEPALAVYRRPIQKIRRMKAHILSPQEEALLAAAGEISSAPSSIASSFRNADLRFPDVADSKGQTHPLTQESLVFLLRGDDAGLRKTTFETFYNTLYGYNGDIILAQNGQRILSGHHAGRPVQAADLPRPGPAL